MMQQNCPFLQPGEATRANMLAIVQLSKDDLIPVYLRDTQGEHDGYKEGHVLNTRFGSFPHSTLIGVPWGSQVRASNVDTGSRGRKKKNAGKQAKEGAAALFAPGAQAEDRDDGQDEHISGALKRKRNANDEGEKRLKNAPSQTFAEADAADGPSTEQPQQAAAAAAESPFGEVLEAQDQCDNDENRRENGTTKDAQAQQKIQTTTAMSGFVHILPPTPEIWTSSLPHRTQVVYTPDYSYVLQRIRARPGSRLIEAGSGSGSFTHASARAVYDGAPGLRDASRSTGKVFSFEFHEQRFEKMRREINEHGLGQLVDINHRDVYNDGFLVGGKSPEADAVFLDLPAPWLALPHLSRRKPQTGAEMQGVEGAEDETWVSPLNPKKSVYICTFSPCIEQVTRTVSEMRKLGWVEIDMVEISHKRLQVYREKVGLNMATERGTQLAPKDVAEAIAKLKEIEVKAAEHNAKMLASHGKQKAAGDDEEDDMEDVKPAAQTKKANGNAESQGGKAAAAEDESKDASVKSFMQGQLVTRPETEIKAHTSYLVFAILPREWTEEDEAAAAAKWPVGNEQKVVIGATDRATRKKLKWEMLQGKGKKGQKAKQGGKGKPAAEKDAQASERTPNGTKAEEAIKQEDVTMGEVTAE